MFLKSNKSKGFLLLDILVGVALFSTAFLGLFGVIRLAGATVSNTKSRIGALALATEELEYLRSLPYSGVGTVGGVPAGAIPQSESILLNGITYTRQVAIDYVDDPADGVGYTGVNKDTNSIIEDYKKAKVTVSWLFNGTSRSFSLFTTIIPKGVEQPCVGCGSLDIMVKNSVPSFLPGANVTVTNYTVTPSVFETRATGPDGHMLLSGLPVGSGYHIVVTEPGYSTDQTYDSTVANPGPNPGNLSVGDQASTPATFQIDTLASKTIQTYKTPTDSTWTDGFSNNSKISESASTTISGGSLKLANTAGSYEANGYAYSVWITPASLYSWKSFSWNDTKNASTTIVYKIYYENGGTRTLIPDTDLPGNSAGFASSPVSLSNLNIAIYPKIEIGAFLSTTDILFTPTVEDWTVVNVKHEIFPNFSFSMHGTKTIGISLYKYSQNLQTNGSGTVSTSSVEFDSYAITPSTGYDISESCLPQPRYVNPGENATVSIDLTTHTTNSLLVFTRTTASGTNPTPIPNPTIRLYDGAGFDQTKSGSTCGQAVWGGLTSGTYSLDVGASGYSTTTVANFAVTGTMQQNVSLTP